MTAGHSVYTMVIDTNRTSTPTAPEVSVRPRAVGEGALKVIIGLGILLRLYHFAARRSLWIDEARLALDILSRGYIDLLRPLDWDQSAAPGFLWLTRFVTQLIGSGELALRAVAFVAGVGALLLLYRITRQLLPGFWGRAFVLSWGALGPQLIYYSNEVKPYSLDLLVNLLLTGGALPLMLNRSRPASHNIASLILAGVLAPWFSAPAVFTLVAVVVAMVVRTLWGNGQLGRTAADSLLRLARLRSHGVRRDLPSGRRQLLHARLLEHIAGADCETWRPRASGIQPSGRAHRDLSWDPDPRPGRGRTTRGVLRARAAARPLDCCRLAFHREAGRDRYDRRHRGTCASRSRRLLHRRLSAGVPADALRGAISPLGRRCGTGADRWCALASPSHVDMGSSRPRLALDPARARRTGCGRPARLGAPPSCSADGAENRRAGGENLHPSRSAPCLGVLHDRLVAPGHRDAPTCGARRQLGRGGIRKRDPHRASAERRRFDGPGIMGRKSPRDLGTGLGDPCSTRLGYS